MRFLLRDRSEEDGFDDLTALGASKELLEELGGPSGQDSFEVLEENEETVLMFLRMATQWNTDQGAYVGLNYQSAEFLFKIYGVQDPMQTMDGLRVMEAEALNILNRRGK